MCAKCHPFKIVGIAAHGRRVPLGQAPTLSAAKMQAGQSVSLLASDFLSIVIERQSIVIASMGAELC